MRHPTQVEAAVGPDGGMVADSPTATAGEVRPVGDGTDVDGNLLPRARKALQVSDGGPVRDAVGQLLALVDLDGVVRRRLVIERVGGLLVVQARREEQAVQP